jgi:hypothetical protein
MAIARFLQQRQNEEKPNRRRLGFGMWWSRRESNPRPQAITGQFYMRSWLICFLTLRVAQQHATLKASHLISS